jgi:RNA polymerase sigma-70 factor (ECF subfamily)
MIEPKGDIPSRHRLQDPSLNQTLAQAASGHQESWRRIVTLYTGRVYGLLVKQCHDQELAAEITQATFVQVVQRLDRYQEQGHFEPWLFRIAINRLRDEMRRRKRQAIVTDMSPGAEGGPHGHHAAPGAGPLEQLSQAEDIQALKLAMTQLTEADQEILYLRHTAGLSFAQIAQTLEQPLGTVLARGHRALAKLRKIMIHEDGSG